MQYSTLTELKITKQDILNCSYSNWFRFFRDYVISDTAIIRASKEFVSYLTSDDIVLPADSQVTCTSDNEYSDWEETGEVAPNPFLQFPEFHSAVCKEISRLGSVTPKLNWSAPKDATWITMNNDLKCDNVSDVYLLLKSSNYIMHDLTNHFDEVVDPETEVDFDFELVIRKWVSINPALEFRVFVKDSTIIGVSQRDLNYYDYLEELKPQLQTAIDHFIETVVFPSDFVNESFCIDLFIPRPFDRVYIIDINPFQRATDPLLFTWNELLEAETAGDVSADFRLINENNLGRFAYKEHSENQVPLDIVDSSMDSHKMVDLLKTWKKVVDNEQDESESESEGSESGE